jgi:hypothetical protein
MVTDKCWASILNRQQGQPFGRGGRGDDRSVPLFYRSANNVFFHLSAANCQQGSGNRPHRVTQKPSALIVI